MQTTCKQYDKGTGSGCMIILTYIKQSAMNVKVRYKYVSRFYDEIICFCRLSFVYAEHHFSSRGEYFPEWEIDWSDTQPQCSRQSLTISNFLPSEDDSRQLKERAMHYTMQFLVSEFTALAGLKAHVPSQKPLHPAEKSQIIPMSILFKNEIYKTATLEILTQYLEDAQLSGAPSGD